MATALFFMELFGYSPTLTGADFYGDIFDNLYAWKVRRVIKLYYQDHPGYTKL